MDMPNIMLMLLHTHENNHVKLQLEVIKSAENKILC